MNRNLLESLNNAHANLTEGCSGDKVPVGGYRQDSSQSATKAPFNSEVKKNTTMTKKPVQEEEVDEQKTDRERFDSHTTLASKARVVAAKAKGTGDDATRKQAMDMALKHEKGASANYFNHMNKNSKNKDLATSKAIERHAKKLQEEYGIAEDKIEDLVNLILSEEEIEVPVNEDDDETEFENTLAKLMKDKFDDEIDDSAAYAMLAVKYPEFAKYFDEMSADEKKHSEYCKEMAAKAIEMSEEVEEDSQSFSDTTNEIDEEDAIEEGAKTAAAAKALVRKKVGDSMDCAYKGDMEGFNKNADAAQFAKKIQKKNEEVDEDRAADLKRSQNMEKLINKAEKIKAKHKDQLELHKSNNSEYADETREQATKNFKSATDASRHYGARYYDAHRSATVDETSKAVKKSIARHNSKCEEVEEVDEGVKDNIEQRVGSLKSLVKNAKEPKEVRSCLGPDNKRLVKQVLTGKRETVKEEEEDQSFSYATNEVNEAKFDDISHKIKANQCHNSSDPVARDLANHFTERANSYRDSKRVHKDNRQVKKSIKRHEAKNEEEE